MRWTKAYHIGSYRYLKGGAGMALQNKLDKDSFIHEVKFNADGLVPAIAQQFDTGEVLMLAWMNADSLAETIDSKRACYWSRSRQSFWRKGDSSGHIQMVKDIKLDCDGDTILLLVDQTGAACHTGERSCFFRDFDESQ